MKSAAIAGSQSILFMTVFMRYNLKSVHDAASDDEALNKLSIHNVQVSMLNVSL